MHHPIPLGSTTGGDPLSGTSRIPQVPEDVRVESDQHIVVHDLPDGQLRVESAVRVVVHQGGAQQVVERYDEQIVGKEYRDTDLLVEQDGAVHLQLDEHGDVTADLTGAVNVTEQPADPTDAVPDGGVVVIQDHDLVITDFDDGTAADMLDPAVFGDFEQSAWAVDDVGDGEADIFSIAQDQTSARLEMDDLGGTPFHDPAPYQAPYQAPLHETPPYEMPLHEMFETAAAAPFDIGDQSPLDPPIDP